MKPWRAAMNVMALVVLLGTTVQAEETAQLEVKPLKRRLDDVGCEFKFKNPNDGEGVLFVSGQTDAWMNLNGKEVKLIRKAETEGGEIFQVNDITVDVKYGPAKQYEGGGSYENSTFTLKRKGQTRVIKARGSCGC